MIRDLLLLARAPLAAGAVCNLLLGLVATWPPEQGLSGRLAVALALLAVTTLAMYWAGMILNDWFDRKRDAELYPGRPIPSGRVDAGVAFFLGVGLILVGLLTSSLASLWAGGGLLRGLLAGGAVAASVLAYDGFLKHSRPLGSLGMASCRVTNALLGPWALGFALTPDLWVYLPLLGVYIYSLTYLSTFEDEDAPSGALVSGFVGCLACPGVVLWLSVWPTGPWHLAAAPAALLLGLVLIVQLFAAIERGTCARGEATTRALLKAIWLLDLSVLLALGAWPALAGWLSLYVVGKAGASLLFAR
jgi:4-hydroxybenzoate polyprenyltransferase